MKRKDNSRSAGYTYGYGFVCETCTDAGTGAEPAAPAVKELNKSDSGNPMLGFDADGNILYGGDRPFSGRGYRILLCRP